VRRGLIGRIVTFRDGEAVTAVLMFAYSFLAMTSYNILKPVTRSQFISALGADNLPYVQLAAGVLIGIVMQIYSAAAGRLPRRWVIPATQLAEVALLTVFWFLFRTGADWVSVAFYVLALILGILLTSQFWTLANDIYDARQAKRLFGFIGGGASLGGATGAGLTSLVVSELGTNNLLLVSAGILALCALLVMAIVRREGVSADAGRAPEEHGIGGGEAVRMLRSSRHLQLIALVIGLAAIGAAIIEQQLNMAAEAMKGSSPDTITAFLAEITFYLSVVGFVVQVIFTSRIHRSLGLAFALLILPVSLGTTAMLILWSGALWTAGAARVLDTSLRYTVDKTTREVLFLPLPASLKYRAKPFVDVTVDRSAKAIGALLALVLIKPWGFHLDWWRLSYASLAVTALWIVLALRARREYLSAFRRSIGMRSMVPSAVRLDVADGATIALLVEELASPDESRVLYAIDMLETLGRKNLITPLLLHHPSPKVRTRALTALEAARPSVAEPWLSVIGQLLTDSDGGVRGAAVHALASLRKGDAVSLIRRCLRDPEPHVAVTAAMVLADSDVEADAEEAAGTLTRFVENLDDSAAAARREVAAALGRVKNPTCRSLLVPLIGDGDVDVARTAIHSAGMLEPLDVLFVPALVSRLGNRRLKPDARHALVSYGEGIIPVLAYFMKDGREDRWVRLHIPGTLARIPSQRAMDTLFDALSDPDGFLRYKVLAAIERLQRHRPDLVFDREPVEALLIAETTRYYQYLTLRFDILHQDAPVGWNFRSADDERGSLLERALTDKLERSLDRIFRLLGFIHPWKDVAAARETLASGEPRSRAAAIEYLDNLLDAPLRKRVMPILEDTPIEEKIAHAHALLKIRSHSLEASLGRLVRDDDPVISAAAIQTVARRRLWSLAVDLEYVRAHSHHEDSFVVEAASLALARRMPGEGRHRRVLSTVEVVDRLRAIPLFHFASVDELFRIASTSRQTHYGGGVELYLEGARADHVTFLIEGHVSLVRSKGLQRTVAHAPAALAFLEMLQGSQLRQTVRTLDEAVGLSFTADQFLTLVSDNVALAQGLFRMLLEMPGATRPLVHGALPGFEPVASGNGPVQPLEKVILLEQSAVLCRATVKQLLALAGIAQEVPLNRGATVLERSDSPAVYYVLNGAVRLESDETEPAHAGPGAMFGTWETLAGIKFDRRAFVTRDGSALRFDREDLLDLLADDTELVRGMFAVFLEASQVQPVLR
jgi:AAA family ATP:ADP antiporter